MELYADSWWADSNRQIIIIGNELGWPLWKSFIIFGEIWGNED